MRSPRIFLREVAAPDNPAARIVLISAYLLLIIVAYTATKAVRDSLFVIRIGPSQLPLLYVAIAACMAAISTVYPTALRRLGLHALVRLTCLATIASLLVFWKVVAYEQHISLYVLYVWVSLFGAIAASQAWSLAAQVFDAREARRSYAWIGLGGVIGGIGGGSLATVVAPRFGTEILLPICAALMGIAVVILQILPRASGGGSKDQTESAPDKPDKSDMADKSADSGAAVLARVRESPYLSMLAALLIVGVIIEAFIDYEFKFVARQAFDSQDQLTSYFGAIASYSGALALIIQIFLTNRLLKRFGVGVAILLFPAALLFGFLLVAARPVLWAVSVLKLADGGLSYSVHRSGMELLYVPIAAKLRASVKALVDLLVDRGGRAAGGALLLLMTAGLSLSIPSLSIVAAAGLVVWIGMAIAIRRNYVDAFRVALEKKVVEPEALEMENVDRSIIRALLNALSSADDRQVLYALDLLGAGPVSRWGQYIPPLVGHKSPSVRSRTIALLTEKKVFSPSYVEPRLTDPELEVRIEAVRHLCEAGRDHARAKLMELRDHQDFRIVVAAIHCIAQYRPADGDLINEPWIEKALRTPGKEGINARVAAARALAVGRVPRATQLLDRLLRDPDAEVVRQAIESSGDLAYEGAVPALISMLARAPLRRTARCALLKMNGRALEELQARLLDDRVPLELRARIPKALSLVDRQDIADFLLAAVHRVTPRLDLPLLKALTRMRALFAGIQFDAGRVSSAIHDECERHGRLLAIRQALEWDERDDREHREDLPYLATGNTSDAILALLIKAIDERLAESVDRVFRLLSLIYTPADIRSVYFTFSARPALRASAVEFLDNLLDSPLRELVVTLVEHEKDAMPDRSKENTLSRADAIHALLATDAADDDWLKTIAGELAGRWAPVEAHSHL